MKDYLFKASLPDAVSAQNLARRYALVPVETIDMILYCPRCHYQHIDGPDAIPKVCDTYPPRTAEPWTNPPHRSHLCAACGFEW